MDEIRQFTLGANGIFFNNKIKNQNLPSTQESQTNLISRIDGVDSVTLTGTSKPQPNSAETWQDILEEFTKAYGEGRSLEQAKLGIEYMNKILACEDLPENLRADFETQKMGYEMMAAEFENYEKQGSGEKVFDVWNEFETFTAKYKKNPDNASYEAGTKYWLTYHETCISFYQRLLLCDNLTDELKTEYERSIQGHLDDINRIVKERDEKNSTNSENELTNQGLTNEIINILEEFDKAYGEGRSLEQAKLGIEYMNKILACEDLPENLRADFETQKMGYEMMAAEFENYEKQGSGEKVFDVWNEFETFTAKYKKNPDNASYEAGTKYWLTYHETCISFYQRLLLCDNLTDELKTEYKRSIQGHLDDINRIVKERDKRNSTDSENEPSNQNLTNKTVDEYFTLAELATQPNRRKMLFL